MMNSPEAQDTESAEFRAEPLRETAAAVREQPSASTFTPLSSHDEFAMENEIDSRVRFHRFGG